MCLLLSAGCASTGPCWSEISAGTQSLYLPHSKQVVRFQCDPQCATHGMPASPSANDSTSAWIGGWHQSSTVQLPSTLAAGSLSPDGQVVAALKLVPNETGVSTLVHVDLTAHTQHTVVERFRDRTFEPQWLPCQRSAEQRAYLLADMWDHVHLCNCHEHCVVRIIECRVGPSRPDDFPESFDHWLFVLEDGRAAVMRGSNQQDVHVLTWRSLLQPA